MTLAEINELIKRINRISDRLKSKCGEGYFQEVPIKSNGKVIYEINNIISESDYKTEILNIAIWIWSLKNYIKDFLSFSRGNPTIIENFINRNFELQVCMDIANRAKHPNLTLSRSRLFPKLGKLKLRIKHSRENPQMERITFTDEKVSIDVINPENVIYELPVIDSQNNYISNAEDIIKRGFNYFEQFLTQNNFI